MSGSKDTGWHIVIHVEKERHRKYVLKLAKKVIPDVPIEVSVTGIIVAH